MIRTRTTFVVGAGASCAHGLPTGTDLKKWAIGLNIQEDVGRLVDAALWKQSLDTDNFFTFRQALSEHNGDSIDELLENCKADPTMVKTGKTVMAALLGESLTRQTPVSEEHDWLKYTVRKMAERAGSAGEFNESNSVQFVTFNFDTLIENRLPELFRQSFPLEDIAPAVKSCQVIHVHGKVESIPGSPMKWDHFSNKHMQWIQWIVKAADVIKVTSDEIADDVLAAAKSAVKEARILCFLGFSYNQANLNRLGINELNRIETVRDISGSAFGLTQAARDQVLDSVGRGIHLFGPKRNCRQVFDDRYVV